MLKLNIKNISIIISNTLLLMNAFNTENNEKNKPLKAPNVTHAKNI